MSAVTITSTKFPEGFPEGTTLYVEWVAQQKTLRNRVFKGGKRTMYKERRRVWKGKVQGQFTRNFDPGKYVWKAHKEDPEALDNFSELGTFLVGMTEDQWNKIMHMKPKMQKARMTSDGVVFTCQFPGCGKMSTSKISSLLHETWEHYGIDLLKEPEREKEAKDKMETVVQAVTEKKRGPGRPRKVN